MSQSALFFHVKPFHLKLTLLYHVYTHSPFSILPFSVPSSKDSQNLALDFERNTSTLSEFIGYIDVTDFRQISPKHSRKNDKQKCVGKFLILKYLSRASIYATRLTYFQLFQLQMPISKQTIRIKKKPDTLLLIDALGIDCAANLLVLRRPIPDKFNRRTLGRFTPYRLLTLPKRNTRLNYIFIINYSYSAFF